MPHHPKSWSRLFAALIVAVSVSGCSGWVERQMASAERALDCAVIATAPVAQTAQCDRHPAARS